MRSADAFFTDFIQALTRIDPASRLIEAAQLRLLAQTELCLHFLHRFLPDETARAAPALMMGYPNLLGASDAPERNQALANLRHLCSAFGSLSAWIDALKAHKAAAESFKCYRIRDGLVSLRGTAPRPVLAILDDWLARPVPWTERRLAIAKPGEATVILNRGAARASYTIPPVPATAQIVDAYAFKKRSFNPPIRVSIEELRRIARDVDVREQDPRWPAESLPRLNLEARLRNLGAEDIQGFFDGQTFTLSGATHVVGMLSSGKSTFVLALLFALTLGGAKKRIALLVSDTMQGATLAARLRRHAVNATVLSSLRNRKGHLQSIHWQRSLNDDGWSLSSIGELSEGFSTACPLDGAQSELIVTEGDGDAPTEFPDFPEKPCHRLYQRQPRDAGADDEAAEPDDVPDDVNTSSCPLWAQCPAQAQQRQAVSAQVLIMTPAAFVHMTPDVWTTRSRLSFPELVQYEFDLVIVDEADGVQKALDDMFAPRTPIMGDEQNTYAPSIGLRSSEALRQRSGVQFRKTINAKWQSNFFTFFGLIGTIYAMLQNERQFLEPFYKDTPFTAGGILYDLWRRRLELEAPEKHSFSLDDPVYADEFLEVIKVAGAINRYSKSVSVSEDDNESESPRFSDERFSSAARGLQEIARQVLVSDYYEDLVDQVAASLDDQFQAFNASSAEMSAKQVLDRRTNALALVLATVTDLALSHYSWLIKTQSAVARDFQIDDGYLFGQASGLIKNYRTLIPANPAGAAFGLFYDDPHSEHASSMGGKLTLISHLGVGRHLLTHLHELLSNEGQAGPHTLMLSGTSWAGGQIKAPDPKTGRLMTCSSPSFDVQTPVKGVLVQPKAELEAIAKSSFSLIHLKDADGAQYKISGMPQSQRRNNLVVVAERLATPIDGANRIESDWRRLGDQWRAGGEEALNDRRRTLLVTNSYADAEIVANALADALRRSGYENWIVNCLVRDREDGENGSAAPLHRLARITPRSLIERFGMQPEHSILIAPIQVVSRGHNILNRSRKAAISSIYFLHRVHPRPDDLGPTIGRLNRFAKERFDHGLQPRSGNESLLGRAQRMRFAANHIVRHGLEAGRGGYQSLPLEYKAQFAWDLLAPLWQTVGRGIRGGCPVFAGFIDNAFAPMSFSGNGKSDNGASSVLVQCIEQLALAMSADANPKEYEVAKLLYEPFYDALKKTEGLRYEQQA